MGTAQYFELIPHEADEPAEGATPQGMAVTDKVALTLAEAGALLGISSRKVYDLLHDGLPCVRLGERTLRIRPQALADYVQTKERRFGDGTPTQIARPLPPRRIRATGGSR